MSLSKCYSSMISTLSEGDISGAKKFLRSVDELDHPVDKRIALHMEAKVYLYQGDFKKVISILEEARANYGVYIGQLCDLMVCYYNTNNSLKMVEVMNFIEEELSECQNELSFSSQVKTKVLLAKMHEETGEIRYSLKLYKKLLEQKKLGIKDRMMILAQVLRVKALHGINKSLARDYQSLQLAVRNSLDYHFSLEVEHSLLLSELILFNEKIAFVRLERLLNDSRLLSLDRDLLLFDSLEILLKKNFSLAKDFASKYLKDKTTDDEVEKMLLDIVFERSFDEDAFIKLYHQIPLGQFLRLYLRFPKRDQKWALFLITGLSEDSQKLWRTFFDSTTCESGLTEIRIENKTLISRYGKLSLSRKKSLLLIVELFFKKKTLSKDELIFSLWGVKDANTSYHERLRTSLRRVNKDIKSISGYPLISMNKDNLELNPKINLLKN